MKIRESMLDDRTVETLVNLSVDWEAENSCHGYRRNGREDLEGNRVFLAEENGDFEKARPILDYVLPSDHEDYGSSSEGVELTAYEFDFVPIVNFGCEGIYLDCCLEGKFDESGRHTLHIGTLKTLERSLEAVKIMAELGGALLYYENQYVNKNLHRFTPQATLEREYQRMLERENAKGGTNG